MQKWEYFLFCSEVCVKPSAMFQMEESDARRIWANHPNSDLAKIEELGKQGWEMISVTPIVTSAPTESGLGGTTRQILFSFKRPLE